MSKTAMMHSSVSGVKGRSGKVRDLYDLGDRLLMVATDRISAYDVIMANGIPDKGRVLTQISLFWFDLLKSITPHHVVSSNLADLPVAMRSGDLDGRFLLCVKAKVVPIECVVRGYLAGSGWKEYQAGGSVTGIALPAGLRQCSKLPRPIFTPATKAQSGHDENIDFAAACKIVGKDVAAQLRDRSLALYEKAAAYAASKGIIIADTKFEWGHDETGNMILIDEVFTPDSSRFWPADAYQEGRDQPSFDKQFVRDYLDRIGFNRTPPGPVLPDEIVARTRQKYVEAFTRLTGRKFAWE